MEINYSFEFLHPWDTTAVAIVWGVDKKWI